MTTTNDSTGAPPQDDLEPAFLQDVIGLAGQARREGWSLSTVRQALGEYLREYGAPPPPMEPVTAQIPELLAELRRRADYFSLTGEPLMGWRTGLPTLDERVGGLQGGRMTVLIAQPGQGKTTLAAQIAHHVAGQGAPVLYLTFENTAQSLLLRMIAGCDNIPVRAAERGEFPMQGYNRAVARFQENAKTLHVVDGVRQTTFDVIDGYATELVRRYPGVGSPLIVVDYLQRLAATDLLLTDARMRVEQTSAKLSELAKRINGHVIAISSTNRAAYSTKDSRPTLASARESGAIEFDADVVLALAKPEKEDFDCPQGKDELVLEIAKNRHGAMGSPIELYRDWGSLSITERSEPVSPARSTPGRSHQARVSTMSGRAAQ